MCLIKYIKKLVAKVVNGQLLSQQTSLAAEGDYTDNGIKDCISRLGAEGCVLLKNDGGLPLKEGEKINLFGRVFIDYYYVGYGSGGDVRAPYLVSVKDGLENFGIEYNKDLYNAYKKYCSSPLHTPDEGLWGAWPTCRDEMPVSHKLISMAKQYSDTAVVFIGRGAGEDKDTSATMGGYYLTVKERMLLKSVTSAFEKTIVVLNIGNVMDLSWVNEYDISSVLCVWQGGMESGNVIASVLSGKNNPSGKLTATVAKDYSDYPSSREFGKKENNRYKEDIFVGYRYFSTFAPEKVLYPFGFGLSYTRFEILPLSAESVDDEYKLTVSVKNVGDVAGKEVVQAYVSCPQGKLGKSKLSLVGFKKTKLLEPGEVETIDISFDSYSFASFDDLGKTGNKSSYVLEEGEYSFFIGNSSTDLKLILKENKSSKVFYSVTSLFPLKTELTRLVAVSEEGSIKKGKEKLEPVQSDLKERILSNLPKEIPYTGDKGYKLKDVLDKKVSLDDFVAQLDDKDMNLLARGEGCTLSSLGAPGNTGVMCGVSERLRYFGIPPVTTTDGPSGIRLKKYCTLLPCGTAIASSWNTELILKTFEKVSDEMTEKGSDILLAPGLNIQRNPLCGRNFEYFSEDPLISGTVAAVIVKGIQSTGVSACPKHFACNNQEYKRTINNSIVSERALREIYLKGFEICVKESAPITLMTSYNKLNEVWSHYNFDLAYILRKEWGYKGTIMTDWWMKASYSPEFPLLRDNAYRVRAGINVLMPGNMTYSISKIESNDTLIETLGKEGGITRGELQRNSKEVLALALYKLMNTKEENV